MWALLSALHECCSTSRLCPVVPTAVHDDVSPWVNAHGALVSPPSLSSVHLAAP